jgi:CubicO group peptidase (beta-lactamase class C family)
MVLGALPCEYSEVCRERIAILQKSPISLRQCRFMIAGRDEGINMAPIAAKRRFASPTIRHGVIFVAVGLITNSICHATPASQAIDSYLRPFVATNNFSGSVLVTDCGRVIFEKSYGFANHMTHDRNSADTRFHIASLSMLFTAFAAMRLVEQNKLSLDTHVAAIVADLPNGDRITVRELLEENSGLPDANDLPNYDELLNAHQTPDSLVQAIRGHQPLAEPGGKHTDEEHSAYNVLALIIERLTRLPFAQAMRNEVFEPAGMKNSGADDDGPIGGRVALGYRLSGEFGTKPADGIHWSAKTGNGSDYSTVKDLSKWLVEFLSDGLLSAKSRAIMLAADKTDDGFGWEKGFSPRFDETLYRASGRSPGFASVMLYLPNEQLAIIVLTNIEHAMNNLIAENIAAAVLGKPYVPFADRPIRLTEAQRQRLIGQFTFGPDFYRRNATLVLRNTPQGLVLDWPGGPEAPLLSTGPNSFIDRYYWIRGTVVQDAAGRPLELKYGRFRGSSVPSQ